MAFVEKANSGAPKLQFTSPFFVFFTHGIKNIFSPQKIMDENKLFRCTPEIFYLIF
jgi:hypothetical protein